MKKILLVFGTRPEAIKMVSVYNELRTRPNLDTRVCVTAQHREMLDQVLSIFKIVPEYDLNLMQPGQSLHHITAKILEDLNQIFLDWEPDLILVHGDTTTTLASSLAAFYSNIAIGHVEAGLRTGDIFAPFPEEVNRIMTSIVTDLHFAPTEIAKVNLLTEGKHPDAIFVTGNTVVDTLKLVQKKLQRDPQLSSKLDQHLPQLSNDKKVILVTGHRRENFGKNFQDICIALKKIAQSRADVEIVYPVHLNPNVRKPVRALLSDFDNIHLIDPINYLPFVNLMINSYMILTDSGGIQEEAPTLGIPVLVMRDKTERPEAVNSGAAKLVGTDPNRIFDAVTELLDNEGVYEKMASAINPYGVGLASKKIANIIEDFFE